MAPSVLIIGASGNFGPAVVRQFKEQLSSFNRIAILANPARDPSKFDKYKASGIEVVVGKWDESRSYEGFDTVVSLVGNQLLKSQSIMIDAAIPSGVRHFYPSEYGAEISLPPNRNTRYFRDKHLIRQHLEKKAKEVKSFGYTYLITGLFTEYATSPFFGIDSTKKTMDFYGTPEAEISLTAVDDAARFLVSSILLPTSPGERTLRAIGGTYTLSTIMSAIETYSGDVYTKIYHPLSSAYDKQSAAAEKGDTDTELLWSLRATVGAGNVVVPKPWDSENSEMFEWKTEGLEQTLGKMFGRGQ